MGYLDHHLITVKKAYNLFNYILFIFWLLFFEHIPGNPLFQFQGLPDHEILVICACADIIYNFRIRGQQMSLFIALILVLYSPPFESQVSDINSGQILQFFYFLGKSLSQQIRMIGCIFNRLEEFFVLLCLLVSL